MPHPSARTSRSPIAAQSVWSGPDGCEQLPSKNSAVPPPTATESGNGVIGDTRSGAAFASPFGKDPKPSPPIREDARPYRRPGRGATVRRQQPTRPPLARTREGLAYALRHESPGLDRSQARG